MNTLPNIAPYETALKFYKAAKFLEQQDGDFVEVVIMQHAFAAELSLKSFFVENSPVSMNDDSDALLEDAKVAVHKKGLLHNLKHLFDRLLPEVQKQLSTFFYEETGRDLRNLTETCAECFTQSRYWFELYGTLPVDDVRTLSRGLIKAVGRYAEEVGEH